MSILKSTPRKTVTRATKAATRIMSALFDRLQLAARAGIRFGGKRNFYETFGYETRLTSEMLLGKYMRQDITSRIIDAPPEALWSDPPMMEGEAKLVTAWDALVKQHQFWSKIERADRLARLGAYSGLLIGTTHGSRLQSSLVTQENNELIYLRPLGDFQLGIKEFEKDHTNPRFGRPSIYNMAFDNPNDKVVSIDSVTIKGINQESVHWSRIVHIVENPLHNESIGVPIIVKIFNTLDDILKVAGGTAETYWLTANRGIQADIDKDMEIDPDDAAQLSDQIEDYQHQLRRIIRTRGVKMNVLGSDTPKPKEVFDMLISIIAGTTGIPKRILIGVEAGSLASEQDRANWAERIVERRKLFGEPYVLTPLVDRLQQFGLLPEGEYEWKWPEAFKISPLERAQTMAATARAAGNLSRQTGNKTPMPITTQEEARGIIGLEGTVPVDTIMEGAIEAEQPKPSSTFPPGKGNTEPPKSDEDED